MVSEIALKISVEDWVEIGIDLVTAESETSCETTTEFRRAKQDVEFRGGECWPESVA